MVDYFKINKLDANNYLYKLTRSNRKHICSVCNGDIAKDDLQIVCFIGPKKRSHRG